MLSQLVAAGIVSGSIYALVGVGIAVAYKATEIISFAQGVMAMLGAYIAVMAATSLGWSYPLACLLALAGVTIVAWVIDGVVYQRLVNAAHVTQVLATLGVANVLKGGILMVWGTTTYAFPPSDRMRPVLTVPLIVTGHQILIVVSSALVVVLLTAFFGLSRWGKAMRALPQSRIGANLCGIRTSSVFRLANIGSAILGAVAGVLYAPLTLVDPSFDWILAKGFAAAVAGGLTSPAGAIGGGLMLGLAESLWAAVLPAVWSPVFSYVLIAVVLLFRPEGLFVRATLQKL